MFQRLDPPQCACSASHSYCSMRMRARNFDVWRLHFSWLYWLKDYQFLERQGGFIRTSALLVQSFSGFFRVNALYWLLIHTDNRLRSLGRLSIAEQTHSFPLIGKFPDILFAFALIALDSDILGLFEIILCSHHPVPECIWVTGDALNSNQLPPDFLVSFHLRQTEMRREALVSNRPCQNKIHLCQHLTWKEGTDSAIDMQMETCCGLWKMILKDRLLDC